MPLSDELVIVFRRAQPLTSLKYVQGKQVLRVKNVEERRQEINQLLRTARKSSLTNEKCVEELFKVGVCPLSSNLSQFKGAVLSLFLK